MSEVAAPASPGVSAERPASLGRTMVWLLFLCSGASGLIYEVLWCRQLGLVLGNTVHSMSAVLTAFMGGLALGSWLGGRWCARLRRPLYVYGLLELFIGVYCALLPWAIGDTGPLVSLYRGLYGETGGAAIGVSRFAVCLLLLGIPATCMGATLPVLTQYLVRSHRSLGRTAGALYAVNTFGAVVGAAATGFLLLPLVGKSATNATAVVMNLVLGACAVWLGAREDTAVVGAPEPGAELPRTESAPEPAVPPTVLHLTLATFGVTGFAGMATQIGWTRAISLGTGSSTYAFSLIVSVFILGLGLGGAWGSRRAANTPDVVGLLGRVLLGIGLLGALLSWWLGYGPTFFFFLIAWGASLPWAVLIALQAIGIGLLILAPTFLMGATMPLTMQVAARSSESAGRTVGTLYAVNTAGAILGSFLGGLVLLPLLSIQTTLAVMAMLYTVPGAWLFWLSPSRREPTHLVRAGTLALPALLVLLAAPVWDPLLMSSGLFLLRNRPRVQAAREWRILDALPNHSGIEVLYYREGSSGTVAVRRSAGHLALTVGGKPDASSYGDMSTQISSALVPALLHPAPKHMLVIGLGSGVSAGAALAPDSIERVDALEMSPEVVEASAWFAPYSGLQYTDGPHPWIDTPRLELIVNDGRNHLLLTSRTYDVITCEPSNPWLAGIGNLFTREAFERAHARLNPGGIMCQWIHTYSLTRAHIAVVLRTFSEVFPHIQVWNVGTNDLLMIGADAPLVLDRPAFLARLAQPRVREALARVHLDEEGEYLAAYLGQDEALLAGAGAAGAVVHTDDNLLLEFSAPRALYLPESFLRQALVGDPLHLYDLSTLPPAERSALELRVDQAVRAREHSRSVLQGVGALDRHLALAKAESPRQFWVVETLNAQDAALARARLTGPLTERGPADPVAAVAVLERARDRSSHVEWERGLWVQAQADLAYGRLRAGQADEALAIIGRIDDPAWRPQVALLRARALAAKGLFEEAMAELEVAGESTTLRWAAAELAATLFRDHGRAEDALAVLDDALALPEALRDSSASLLWTQRAGVRADLGYIEEALADLAVATRLAPSDARNPALEARCHAQRGRWDACVPALARRNAIDPENPGALAEFCSALVRQAETLTTSAPARAREALAHARRLARELMMLAPASPAGWEWFCRTHLRLEALAPAAAAFHHAEAHAACREALARHGGDLSKLPTDLLTALK